MKTACNHWFCHVSCSASIHGFLMHSALQECILAFFNSAAGANKSCPCCRRVVKISDMKRAAPVVSNSNILALLPENGAPAEAAVAPFQVVESKLKRLIHEIQHILNQDASGKILVFSQFNQAIEWLQAVLTREGYQYRTIVSLLSFSDI